MELCGTAGELWVQLVGCLWGVCMAWEGVHLLLNYSRIEMHWEHAGRRVKAWGEPFACWYQQLRGY